MMKMQARLLLEDGILFTGQAFGASSDAYGEVVFTTGVTGYQEVLTDPSYCGYIVTMTYPLIGNYGISRDDFEGVRPYIQGLVVREQELVPSNWRAQYTLDRLLKEYDIPGISGIDTRMLTRKIRQAGTLKGLITTSDAPVEELAERLGAYDVLKDQVARVSTKSMYISPGYGERIVVMDFGCKSSILRELTRRGCDIVVVPYDTTSEQIRRLHPDGILLSNGPGDPKQIPAAIRTISELLGEVPIFGICLGHLLLALACGADTAKLSCGHRGNHPVKELRGNRCYITSQNHSFTVLDSSLAGTGLAVTHINSNDGSIEGLRHERYPVFSVQFHPEAAPGPKDSGYLFDEFLDLVREHKAVLTNQPSQVLFTAEKRKGELVYADQ